MKSSARVFRILQSLKRDWKRPALILAVILAAWVCSRYWFQLMLIQGDSMAPTYRSWQLVVLDKRPRDYHRGDVIAFRCEGLNAVLVKRIAAEPGDTAQITDGALVVNSKASDVYDGDRFSFSFAGLLSVPRALDADEYIVIGDNIEKSRDSRCPEVGVVPASSILGRVIAPVTDP